jgi:hypothetical protein
MTGNVRPAMSEQGSPSDQGEHRPEGAQGDPWHAFGYIVSGVALYGFLGWLVDRWLGTAFFVAAGILVGAGLGIYLTFARFNKFDSQHNSQEK